MPSLPTLASVKAKALDAKDYSTKRMSRMQSPASKNLNWDMTKPPPPPPPAQRAELVHSKSFAPPPSRRGTAPTSPTSPDPSGPPPIAPRPTVPPRPSSNSSYGSTSAPSPPQPPRLPARSSSALNPISAASAPSPPPRVPARVAPPSQRSVPPASYTASPSLPSRVPSRAIQEGKIKTIDWTDLSPQDKHEFFVWLDEFFAHRTGKPAPPRAAPPRATSPALKLQPPVPLARGPGARAASVSPSVSSQATPISQASMGGPPPIRRITKPPRPIGE